MSIQTKQVPAESTLERVTRTLKGIQLSDPAVSAQESIRVSNEIDGLFSAVCEVCEAPPAVASRIRIVGRDVGRMQWWHVGPMSFQELSALISWADLRGIEVKP